MVCITSWTCVNKYDEIRQNDQLEIMYSGKRESQRHQLAHDKPVSLEVGHT